MFRCRRLLSEPLEAEDEEIPPEEPREECERLTLPTFCWRINLDFISNKKPEPVFVERLSKRVKSSPATRRRKNCKQFPIKDYLYKEV